MARRTAVTLMGSKVAFKTRTGSCMIAGLRAEGGMAPGGRFSPRTSGRSFGRGVLPPWPNLFILLGPEPSQPRPAQARKEAPEQLGYPPPGRHRPRQGAG